jgi:hypothetical protein
MTLPRTSTGQMPTSPMNKYKPYIITFVIALVAIAVWSRVASVRKVVSGPTGA